ncbi:MAG: MFS transporter [Actinomycetota bacterium]|nr:MFS transporter [Actinomycetota bacterium]
MMMATINSSITLIALPNIFRGIHLNPLAPANTGYLLWTLMSFMVATAVLLVSLGRVGDMFGRVKMYNLGFAIFTLFSVLLAVTWLEGSSAAVWLIAMRVGQGIGAAFLFANSSAILTDAFPAHQRGLALGINNVAGISGSFLGLVLGGILAPIEWRLVFLVSVPFGLFGTVWAYLKLRDNSIRIPARIDWWGNVLFAVGLVAILVGITYGIEPYGHSTMGWTNPMVLGCLIAGVALLAVFTVVETKVAQPMLRVALFKIRAFSAGNAATLLFSLGRGGLMFILIIWLQGIWLPQHGYSFSVTPLWAGIYMLPLTAGFLVAGPVSGILSDRYGARPFATGGMAIAALAYGLLEVIPVDFTYLAFASLLFLMGLGMGIFSAPNMAGIMNSLPPDQRGAGAGMVTTFQNSAMVLSIGVFFTLIILGLSSSLPHSLDAGLLSQGVPAAAATRISHLPPVGSLFAAFLGYNPMQTLLGHGVLSHLSPHHAAVLTGRSFFPRLLSAPFESGLQKAFTFALVASLVAAACSWLRGGNYHHADAGAGAGAGSPSSDTGPVTLDTAGVSPVAAPNSSAAGRRSAAVER